VGVHRSLESKRRAAFFARKTALGYSLGAQQQEKRSSAINGDDSLKPSNLVRIVVDSYRIAMDVCWDGVR
jgi:hypothetical protein